MANHLRRTLAPSLVLAVILLLAAPFGRQPEATYIPSLLSRAIQYGTTTSSSSATTATTTITSVDTTASYVVLDGCNATDASGAQSYVFCRVALTNATTVTITRGAQAGGYFVAKWHVVSLFKPFVKSVQSGTVAVGVSDVTQTSTALSAFTTTRALLVNNGCSSGNFTSSATVDQYGLALDFSDATHVRATRIASGGGTYAADCAFTVVDLR